MARVELLRDRDEVTGSSRTTSNWWWWTR